jgi:phenylpropionate dioxygenase-like ring-hydroxylating dioxygenase large terminal subunit
MRCYWQPAALVDELAGNRPVKPLRLLGESLVLFRDDKGRYGLLERACPHRGTDLAFGRLETGGLRCAFHGWLFDVEGQCLETPAEPEGSRMCANIRQKAYPVVEKSGVLRVQGHDRLQLAAIAGGRYRSSPHLVPASLLP